ncbi:uncharacterized protein LOC120416155 [Culex pipiens pallens]|uniref:uncharacterized protein LOC120416155 n=1 Tax=Culex pipiens pallens TaxID=42434 RepID=UPI0019538228|nr:uncharacterized protein LOC120416155 [Culex pipiens pallens]
MSKNQVLGCSFAILLLVSLADSAKECIQCFGGTADCVGLNKVQCTRENAAVTAYRMSHIFPDAQALTPASDSYYCAEASYSVFVSGENPNLPQIPEFPEFPENTQVVFKVKGCIFAPIGNLCDKNVDVNGQFSCRYCSPDNCNSAFSLGCSLLVLIGCLIFTRFLSN